MAKRLLALEKYWEAKCRVARVSSAVTGSLAQRKVSDTIVRANTASASHMDTFIMARRSLISHGGQVQIDLLKRETRFNVKVRSGDAGVGQGEIR